MNDRNARYARHGHGVTKQVRGAIKTFAAQAKEAPPTMIGEPVMIPIACRCNCLPYPHIMHGLDKERHDEFVKYFKPAKEKAEELAASSASVAEN